MTTNGGIQPKNSKMDTLHQITEYYETLELPVGSWTPISIGKHGWTRGDEWSIESGYLAAVNVTGAIQVSRVYARKVIDDAAKKLSHVELRLPTGINGLTPSCHDLLPIMSKSREGAFSFPNLTIPIGEISTIGNNQATRFPALFVEWDNLTILEQRDRIKSIQKYGVKPGLIVHSGGKSLHSYFIIDEPMKPAQWLELERFMVTITGADPNIITLARKMRVPGALRGENNQEIIYSGFARYSMENIKSMLNFDGFAPFGIDDKRWQRIRPHLTKGGDHGMAIAEMRKPEPMERKRHYSPTSQIDSREADKLLLQGLLTHCPRLDSGSCSYDTVKRVIGALASWLGEDSTITIIGQISNRLEGSDHKSFLNLIRKSAANPYQNPKGTIYNLLKSWGWNDQDYRTALRKAKSDRILGKR